MCIRDSASGVVQDLRLNGPGVYDKLDFEPIVEEAGDCYARAIVRVKELYQAMDMVAELCRIMPEGDIACLLYTSWKAGTG